MFWELHIRKYFSFLFEDVQVAKDKPHCKGVYFLIDGENKQNRRVFIYLFVNSQGYLFAYSFLIHLIGVCFLIYLSVLCFILTYSLIIIHLFRECFYLSINSLVYPITYSFIIIYSFIKLSLFCTATSRRILTSTLITNIIFTKFITNFQLKFH